MPLTYVIKYHKLALSMAFSKSVNIASTWEFWSYDCNRYYVWLVKRFVRMECLGKNHVDLSLSN